MTRVFLVDDHEVVRRGMKQVLAGAPDFVVVGEAASGGEALARLRTTTCDVLVLDLSLPDRPGLEVLKELKVDKPELPVLILTMHREDQYAIRALRAGAAGFLTKESAPEQLITAVRKVARGGRYLTVDLAEQIAVHLGSGAEHPHDRLSDREYQVFVRIVTGRPLTDIAAELDLSVKTVSTHRTRLLEKMGMRSNAELVQYAVHHDLLP
ncbi:MAG TPA: response regulator transcription factor [Vicinamibacteria bacterium]|nr:response regulator transcription factor [Vicinamibacteria bacterium]